MLPPIMIGISSRPIRNVLVRTAALYSRIAMTRTLCMSDALAGGGWRAVAERLGGTSDADEDVLQSRSRQLEVPHGTALGQHGQDALRVGTRVETEFLEIAEVRHLRHAGQVAEVRPP